VCFNLSHSGDVLLVAVARAVEVGVDVERIRADISLEGIAARVMPVAQVAELAALAPDERLEAFYARWTCLEARLKARGMSISVATERAESDAGVGEMTCKHLRPRPGYLGAVAADSGTSWTIVAREWSE
jgi:4'-phosphopantetheinyl transferase